MTKCCIGLVVTAGLHCIEVYRAHTSASILSSRCACGRTIAKNYRTGPRLQAACAFVHVGREGRVVDGAVVILLCRNWCEPRALEHGVKPGTVGLTLRQVRCAAVALEHAVLQSIFHVDCFMVSIAYQRLHLLPDRGPKCLHKSQYISLFCGLLLSPVLAVLLLSHTRQSCIVSPFAVLK